MAVRVEGVGRLRAAVSNLRAQMHAGSRDGQQAVARAVSRDWKANAPVDTGAYRDSIGADDDGAFATAEHGPFVEFGTSTHPAQPVGSEAAARAEQSMPGVVAAKIKRRLPR